MVTERDFDEVAEKLLSTSREIWKLDFHLQELTGIELKREKCKRKI